MNNLNDFGDDFEKDRTIELLDKNGFVDPKNKKTIKDTLIQVFWKSSLSKHIRTWVIFYYGMGLRTKLLTNVTSPGSQALVTFMIFLGVSVLDSWVWRKKKLK